MVQRVQDVDGGVPQVDLSIRVFKYSSIQVFKYSSITYLNKDPVIGILEGSSGAVDGQREKHPFFPHSLVVKSNFLQDLQKIVPTFLPKGNRNNREEDAADLGEDGRGEDVGVDVPHVLVSGDGVEVTGG